MQRNLIIGGVALALLLISIKFFPYHCACLARTAGVGETSASVAATSTPQAGTRLFPAGLRTPEIYMNPTVTIGSTPLAVDVADTPVLREQGLSGRKSLCADCGMLFVFQIPAQPGFWMKDMNFSLDIVWISPDTRIIGVEKDVSPSTYPKAFYPSEVIKYVLELPAGSFDKHAFRVGDSLSLHL